jgi:hypothetical protein
MTHIETMKQALEALERSVATCFDQGHAHRTVMSQPRTLYPSSHHIPTPSHSKRSPQQKG